MPFILSVHLITGQVQPTHSAHASYSVPTQPNRSVEPIQSPAEPEGNQLVGFRQTVGFNPGTSLSYAYSLDASVQTFSLDIRQEISEAVCA